jgi:hypothetical protein
MLEALMAVSATLNGWLHGGRSHLPARYDLDGACPSCDYPFGDRRHMCIVGPVSIVS